MSCRELSDFSISALDRSLHRRRRRELKPMTAGELVHFALMSCLFAYGAGQLGVLAYIAYGL